MKSKLFIMGILCTIAFTANAQTKGTNTGSLGLGFSKQKNTQNNGNGSTSENSSKNSSVALGYGFFFKDNQKLALDLSYGENSSGSSGYAQSFKSYGANLSYQKYYPLVKKLYAFAGGRAGYTYGNQDSESANASNYSSNDYSAGAFGGISLFLSKRFALETSILSANMGYYTSKHTNETSPNYKIVTKNSYFGISNQGVFNDLGFKIYILF